MSLTNIVGIVVELLTGGQYTPHNKYRPIISNNADLRRCLAASTKMHEPSSAPPTRIPQTRHLIGRHPRHRSRQFAEPEI